MFNYFRYGIVTLSCFIFMGCSIREAMMEEKKAGEALEKDPEVRSLFYETDNFKLYYTDTEVSNKPVVVFIHGTPGNWKAFSLLLNQASLRENARLISIDRPGWGMSQFPESRSEPNFRKQSELIAPLLKKIKNESPKQPMILVGHSYGGSIAPYIAYLYPELADGLLIAASAIDPELGNPRWYNRLSSTWFVSKIIGKSLNFSNDEIYGVAPALEELEPWWESSTIPKVFVQGEKDGLVDPKNLDFAEANFDQKNSKVVRIPKQGHLIHLQKADLLTQLTLELIEDLQSN